MKSLIDSASHISKCNDWFVRHILDLILDQKDLVDTGGSLVRSLVCSDGAAQLDIDFGGVGLLFS